MDIEFIGEPCDGAEAGSSRRRRGISIPQATLERCNPRPMIEGDHLNAG
jgi:hypothetical protein